MPIKEILLALTTYPDPTPSPAVAQAVAFAEAMGSRISALAMEARFQLPAHIPFFANALIDIPGLVAGEHERSVENVNALLECFETEAKKREVLRESLRERCQSYEVPDRIAERARYSDLTICPILNGDTGIAEAVIFGSGRPVLVVPATPSSSPIALNTALVAWDGSRTAARAVADALPFLEKVKVVRVGIILDEKPLDTSVSGQELAKFLSYHGVTVVIDELNAGSGGAGKAIEAYARVHNADFLVMGAFGHSRAREFILGGATAYMLKQLPLPMLMSQ
jgi:nucleotide-binding universal stress UspA family protein